MVLSGDGLTCTVVMICDSGGVGKVLTCDIGSLLAGICSDARADFFVGDKLVGFAGISSAGLTCSCFPPESLGAGERLQDTFEDNFNIFAGSSAVCGISSIESSSGTL